MKFYELISNLNKLVLDWSKLHFGEITREEIEQYVNDEKWQEFRESLKGLNNPQKYEKLKQWLEQNNNSRKAQVQVTNYVNALLRGGQITMPYPNEHACRLRSPDEFDDFSRDTREHEGKEYSVIYGYINDESYEQAYRYDNETWTPDAARTHCQNHDGTFEPARPREEQREQNESEEGENMEYKLCKHWWQDRYILEHGPMKYHYDLFIGDKQYVLDDNLVEVNKTEGGSRRPYSKKFVEELNEITYLQPNTPGNPTKDTACWMQVVDEGEVVVQEHDDKTTFKFDGKLLSDRWTVKKKFENTNLYVFTNKTNLSRHKLCAKRMKVELISRDDDDNLVIEGLIIGEGTWNGHFWPSEVIESVGLDTVLGLHVDVGVDHEDKHEDVGQIMEAEWIEEDRGWWVKAVIEDEEAIQLAESFETPGWSIEAMVYEDPVRRMIVEITEMDRVVLVPDPASRVSFVD